MEKDMSKLFTSELFVPTKWATAEEKADFADALVDFIVMGFPKPKFTQKFYARLSNTFGHIAHYDREGFWVEFFTSSGDKLRFLMHTLNWTPVGDPTFVWSDVERVIIKWLRAHPELLDAHALAAHKPKLSVERFATVLFEELGRTGWDSDRAIEVSLIGTLGSGDPAGRTADIITLTGVFQNVIERLATEGYVGRVG